MFLSPYFIENSGFTIDYRVMEVELSVPADSLDRKCTSLEYWRIHIWRLFIGFVRFGYATLLHRSHNVQRDQYNRNDIGHRVLLWRSTQERID